ncbi:MAG: CHAD domain-containing protein [Pseudomonadota bacterium]|nr:CHAD domain-containing protein [Pseudomonadota bacterium]
MEVELKLLVAAADLDAVRNSPLLRRLQRDPPHTVDNTSIYFDTPALTLHRHRAGLRLRRSEGGWVQSFKGGGSVVGGLHSRNEFESAVQDQSLDLPTLRLLAGKGNPWYRLLGRDGLREQLQPIFVTEIRRTIWQLRTDDGTRIECVLDLGSVTAGARTVPISEMELELKEGPPHALFALALALLDEVPLRLGNTSKAAHGYALLMPGQAAADSASAKIALTRATTVENAFVMLVQACLMQMQTHEDGVIAGAGGEPLHRMRVALRKLHGVFQLFSDQITLPETLVDEFAWLAGVLGPARDWDVLLQTTLPRMPDAMLNQVDLLGLVCAVSEAAGNAIELAAAAIASPRYTRLLLGCQQWLLGTEWRKRADTDPVTLSRPVEQFATEAFRALTGKLRRRHKKAVDGDQRMRHRTRIAAKNLRYAVEFFSALYSGKETRQLLKALASLQDELGAANDLVVADRLLQTLASHGATSSDVGYVRGFLAATYEHETCVQPRAWRRLAKLGLHG